MSLQDGVTLTHEGRVFHLSSAAAESIRLHLTAPGGAERRGLLLAAEGEGCEIIAVRPFEAEGETDASLYEVARFSRLFHTKAIGAREELLRPVGWYLSHGKGDWKVTAEDRQFHDSLFADSDLLIVCQRLHNGEIRFSAAGQSPGTSASTWSGWVWPAAAATVFALLCITAAVAFHPDRNLSVDRTAPEPKSFAAPATTAVKPAPDASGLSDDLSFEMARNRRLEATLQILRDRKAHPHSALKNKVAGVQK